MHYHRLLTRKVFLLPQLIGQYVLILDEFHDRGAVFLFLSDGNNDVWNQLHSIPHGRRSKGHYFMYNFFWWGTLWSQHELQNTSLEQPTSSESSNNQHSELHSKNFIHPPTKWESSTKQQSATTWKQKPPNPWYLLQRNFFFFFNVRIFSSDMKPFSVFFFSVCDKKHPFRWEHHSAIFNLLFNLGQYLL